MSAVMSVDIKGLLPWKTQMKILAMPKALRRRLLGRVSRKVISDSKKRVRKQVDVNGQPFVARSKKRTGRRKMLARLSRRLKTLRNDGIQAMIGFPNSADGRIAAKHQHGHTTTVSAKQLNKQGKSASKDNPATRKQAKSLREAGYTVKRAHGKGKKSPSLKYITQNMTIGQAGAVLRSLREQEGISAKTSWQTKLPARAFLGASSQEIVRHIESIFNSMKQELRYGAR